MIYLTLFFTFLKIGAVSFGGGYAMIPLIREEVLAHGWLTDSALLDMIAVSESTPGPIAINMATFIGSAQGGVFGALAATIGVVLPSFLIILLIAAALRHVMQYSGVQAFLGGIRPAIAAMITATAITMIITVVFGIKNRTSSIAFDWRAAVIFATVAMIAPLWRKIGKKKLSPIWLICLSALLGVVLYGFLG